MCLHDFARIVVEERGQINLILAQRALHRDRPRRSRLPALLASPMRELGRGVRACAACELVEHLAPDVPRPSARIEARQIHLVHDLLAAVERGGNVRRLDDRVTREGDHPP